MRTLQVRRAVLGGHSGSASCNAGSASLSPSQPVAEAPAQGALSGVTTLHPLPGRARELAVPVHLPAQCRTGVPDARPINAALTM